MQTRDATNKVGIVPLGLCRLCAPFSVARPIGLFCVYDYSNLFSIIITYCLLWHRTTCAIHFIVGLLIGCFLVALFMINSVASYTHMPLPHRTEPNLSE